MNTPRVVSLGILLALAAIFYKVTAVIGILIAILTAAAIGAVIFVSLIAIAVTGRWTWWDG